MKFNLKSMSRKELEKLASDVEKAMSKVNDREFKVAREAAAKAAAKHGFSLEELSGAPAPAKKARAKTGPKKVSPPKYCNPSDAAQTWTGKGRKPEWFKTAVESGTNPETLEI